jgi:glucose-6-phosphate 1-dehydrogenase
MPMTRITRRSLIVFLAIVLLALSLPFTSVGQSRFVTRRGQQLIAPDGKPFSERNYFRFQLSPEVIISVGTQVKHPGDEMSGETVELVARHTGAREQSPYERLLGDALRGDNSLFTTDASVEAAWRVVDPILDHSGSLVEYECGTWPSAADSLVAGGSGWHEMTTDDH